MSSNYLVVEELNIKNKHRIRNQTFHGISLNEQENITRNLKKARLTRVHSYHSDKIIERTKVQTVHNTNATIKLDDSGLRTSKNVDVERSEDELTNILSKQYMKVSYWNGIHIFQVLAICVLFSSPLTLIPMYDQIRFPEYWWQSIYTINLSFTLSLVLVTIQECKTVFKDKFKISYCVFIRSYVLVMITGIIQYCVFYKIWTGVLGNPHPIPFVGLSGYFMYLITIISVWLQFPRGFRSQKLIQKRFKAYFLYFLWCAFTTVQYTSSTILLRMLPMEIQWLTAVWLLILRELNTMVLSKLIRRAVGTHDEESETTAIIYINCQHAFYVAIAISSTATEATAYVLLIADFASNIYNSYKIIRIDRKITPQNFDNEKTKKERDKEVSMLVLIEIMEILVPLAYAITFVLAYYGPNSKILGNVQNDYWQFQEIRDVEQFLGSLSQMFVIDLMSAVLGGILLKKFCSINVLQEGCKIISVYWPVITLKFVQRINMVSLISLASYDN